MLVATVGPANAVAIDAMSFFAAATVQSTIRSSFRDDACARASGWSPAPPGRRRRRLHPRRPHVATLLGVGFGNSFAFGAVLGLLVPYAVEELGLASDDGRIGILYGAIGAAASSAASCSPACSDRARVPLLTPLSPWPCRAGWR